MKYTHMIIYINNFIFIHVGITKTHMSYIFSILQLSKDTIKTILRYKKFNY